MDYLILILTIIFLEWIGIKEILKLKLKKKSSSNESRFLSMTDYIFPLSAVTLGLILFLVLILKTFNITSISIDLP